jgi:hypothetical protein
MSAHCGAEGGCGGVPLARVGRRSQVDHARSAQRRVADRRCNRVRHGHQLNLPIVGILCMVIGQECIDVAAVDVVRRCLPHLRDAEIDQVWPPMDARVIDELLELARVHPHAQWLRMPSQPLLPVVGSWRVGKERAQPMTASIR